MWWRRALGVAFAHWRRAALPLVPAASRTSQAGAGGCWSCGEAVSAGARFCPSCRALQPPEPSPDLFALLGCERRFEVDAAELRRRFRSLQQALHPDGFASSSPQAERRLSEQHAALLNEAYETLRSPLRRGLYLVSRGEWGGMLARRPAAASLVPVGSAREQLTVGGWARTSGRPCCGVNLGRCSASFLAEAEGPGAGARGGRGGRAWVPLRNHGDQRETGRSEQQYGA
uniref:HscB mitochondrial iron-sulfur cluster cochaperone n=1 Tax=Salvator merianae TaxID=96440 RepID=A0A8D0E619_SALMN